MNITERSAQRVDEFDALAATLTARRARASAVDPSDSERVQGNRLALERATNVGTLVIQAHRRARAEADPVYAEALEAALTAVGTLPSETVAMPDETLATVDMSGTDYDVGTVYEIVTAALDAAVPILTTRTP